MSNPTAFTLSPATIPRLVDELIRRAESATARRVLIGIAGIAASGKSTLAERLCAAIDAARPGLAAFIPLDGFHRPNAELERLGLMHRKGSPPSYDAEAFVELLRRYRDLPRVGGYPIYDRSIHEPVPSPTPITQKTRLIVTEGQYLLLTDEPWDRLAGVLDEVWWLDTSQQQARQWLMQRDLAVGRSESEAVAKYEHNDKLNTEWVMRCSRKADRVLSWG